MAEDPEAALIDQVTQVLADGPIALDDLAELLAEGGYLDGWDADDFDDLVDQLDELLRRYEGIWITATELVIESSHIVMGSVFSHRLTSDDLATGMLDLHPDLSALVANMTGPLPLIGGGELDMAYDVTDDGASAHGSLVGPSGWLDAYSAGDLLTLTRTYDGVLVEAVQHVGEGEFEVALLRRAFDARVPGPEVGDMPFAVVYDAIAADDVAFSEPVRPLGELFEDAGIETRGDWVGTAGADWSPPAIFNAEAERVVLAERYQLDVCCLEAFDDVMLAWNELTLPSGEAVDWQRVAEQLNHGSVAPAFADHVLRDLDEPHPILDEFVGELRRAGGRAVAPASYLAARNLERAGDVLAAETALHGASRADPSFDPAIEELAWYIADRGDADQAINLLRRTGIEADDPELRLLESMRPQRNEVGRNERCPCGSGRKYKDCCQRNPRVPLVQRGDWLLHKLWTFTLRPHHQRHVLGLALVLADDDDDIDELLDIGLPMDLAAFDDDLARAFLAERGVLLPDDEREVLESWVREPRTLWEIVEHEPGKHIALRDTVEERSVVLAGPPDATFEPGDLLYARVGPIADRYRFVGVPIHLEPDGRSSVEALIASRPDAWQIARWFSHLFHR